MTDEPTVHHHPWHDSDEFPDQCAFCGMGKQTMNSHVWKRGNMVGNGRAPKEVDKFDAAKVGGKIHKILNSTLTRRLTLTEYSKLVKLIDSVFRAPHHKGD